MKRIRSSHGLSTVLLVRLVLTVFQRLRLNSRNAVYDKLVRTALRYTPVVLEYHVPYKLLPGGRLCVHVERARAF